MASTDELEERARLARTGIPRRFLSAESPLRLHGRGLYLWGPVGTGKTHDACAVALRAARGGRPVTDPGTGDVLFVRRRLVRFSTLAGAVARVRGTWGTRESSEDVMGPLCRCDLLVLDDLGKEDFSDRATREALWRVVSERYDAALPTVVTSNWARDELAARVARGSGDAELARAVASRLAEMCEAVEYSGADRRLS